jgi:hypothetical protein
VKLVHLVGFIIKKFYEVADIVSSFRIIGHDIKRIPGLKRFFNFKIKHFSE